MKEKEVDLLKFENYSKQLVDIIQAQVHFENLIITKLETQNILNNKYFENNNDALKVAINLKDAWRFIFETYDLPLSPNYILQLHKILMDGLVDGNGYYRNRDIYVSGSKYLPPLLSQYQYKEMLENTIKQNDLLGAPLLIAREQLFNDGNEHLYKYYKDLKSFYSIYEKSAMEKEYIEHIEKFSNDTNAKKLLPLIQNAKSKFIQIIKDKRTLKVEEIVNEEKVLEQLYEENYDKFNKIFFNQLHVSK